MKKVLSLIALAGILTACHQEEIQTVFTVDPALATINVKTILLQSGKEVNASYSASKGNVSGSTVTLKGDLAISKTNVKVDASYTHPDYGLLTGYTNVVVNDLLPAGTATYNAIIYIGAPISKYDITVDWGDTTEDVEVAWLLNAHAVHSHEGLDVWMTNETEFLLEDYCMYPEYSGSEVKNKTLLEDFKSIVDLITDPIDTGITETQKKYEYKIPAWAWYNIKCKRITRTTPCEIKAKLGSDEFIIATFDLVSKASSVEPFQFAAPNHYGHLYHNGHGTLHGPNDNTNAGGGIVFAE